MSLSRCYIKLASSSFLLSRPLPLISPACSLWWSQLLYCDLPLEAHMARNHKRSLDINSLGIEDLNPTTCEELNTDSNHMSELGGRLFPNWTLRWLQPQLNPDHRFVRDPEIEDLSRSWLGSWGTEPVRLKQLCCLKPLNLGVICYVAIGNWYSCEHMKEFPCIQNTSLKESV